MMERAIDRTSYRRSARQDLRPNDKVSEVEIKKSKKFNLINMIMNQIIVSMLIIIAVLIAQYYEMNEVTEWISKNMANGYSATEIVNKIKNHFWIEKNLMILESGEQSGEYSGEKSGEQILNSISGDFLSAVEGINQMAEDVKVIKDNYQICTPLEGTITSTFGSRVSDSSIVSAYHTGLDIAANSGTNICAAHNGKVILAENYSSYGNCVMIENNDIITVYAHCLSINVKEGQMVNKGDIIAKVGMTGNATGPHLHFEIRYNGRFVDPEKILTEL